ncbi:hypothetical protein GQ43DRAFT_364742 [Delitschia confertaspora ATCC 74209]|uniref:Sacsin/Nov domain-containing protein n=1 Tax=Delitschia confertaspora ATCC 74209 TaxID=1513339 RepID=A0A9P4MVR0_9PLEO|nr:hypothetical protein GQ43DRAFT_364742 [Delitschia confertaspora ATCC 74209]
MHDGQDSEVTVNTRALIDKVLARYSSEHTTLRELIQNASDAGATTVIIKLETDPSLNTPTPQTADTSLLLKHMIQHHTLKRLVVSNNGQPFTAADWSRLKSIADGNPDETKIGAFGVGFYSVFADCDEPFVVSGDRTMAFYWKGNTLSTKVATLPPEHTTPETVFSLEYRQANRESPSYNPSKIPNLPTLCQFLCTSLTFVGLQKIELHLDAYKVASFTKDISPSTQIQVPQGLKTQTEGGIMSVSKVTRQNSKIEADWRNVIASAQNPPTRAAEIVAEVRNAGSTLKSFFSKFAAPPAQAPSKASRVPPPAERIQSPEQDIAGDSSGVISLQVCTVEVNTRVTRSFSAEIERATKKPPPKSTRIALLTSPYDDSSASSGSGSTAPLASKIFSEILPTKTGRIFIGFPTAQTTGFLAHVSAPSLIPTVERENVDMNARHISTWNIELLRVAGLACRIAYAAEMADIKSRFHSSTPISELIYKAIYVFQQYTATASHPSTKVGEKIEEAFWNCSKERSIEILSSKGVLPSKSVRMPAETLSFLSGVPMVPQDLATGAMAFMVNLHNKGFISDLTMSDIRSGLESKALTEEELVEFLKWCGSKLDSGEIDVKGIQNLFDITVATVGGNPVNNNQGSILQLAGIRNYVNVSRIPPTLPIPFDTIPFAFTKSLLPKQMQMFGWRELSIVEWLRFMTTSPPQIQELLSSEKLATQVLGVAAKCWDQLDAASKTAVCELIQPHAIMPTKLGMRLPEESYFPSVRLFEDLPTVKHFPGSKDKFLHALGVRKTVELPVIFDRMRTRDTHTGIEKMPWNHGDLIRYFASVIDELPHKDFERLRQTPFLPGEGSSVKEGQLFKAEDLYAPDQAILSLGLVQVKLPFEFRASSKEGTLLLRLGLSEWPNALTIADILHRAGTAKNSQLFSFAMDYFLQNYFRNNYARSVQQLGQLNLPFLPTEQAPFGSHVAPFQCYSNELAACLGFPIIRADLRPHADKFGIRKDPDIKLCIQKLLKQPPKNKADAEMQFSYLASRSSDLDKQQGLVNQLSAAKIVPIFRKYYLDPQCVGFEDRTKNQFGMHEPRIHHYEPPETVFVGRDQDYIGILDYVQYGPEATSFLLKVGAKHEPSTHDLASLLAKNPTRFLNTIGQDRYLDLLRRLAEHADNLWKDKALVKEMMSSRLLLGYRDFKKESINLIPVEEDTLEDFDPDVQREWSLNKADEVAIVDDVRHLAKFRDYIIVAPQEEILEDFYQKFGVKKLSELVKAEKRIGVVVRDQIPAQKLYKDILERARLFLHEYERDSSAKNIRHDTKWLSKNFSVQCVSDISIRYSLAGHNATASRHLTAARSRLRGGNVILYITPTYDIYEVSTELVGLLVNRPKQNDTLALERILTESLRRLQEKGINVERILRRKEYEARIAKQQELERQYEEQQRRAEEVKMGITAVAKEIELPDTPRPPLDGQPTTPERPVNMPGAFGTPEDLDSTNNSLARPGNEKNYFNNLAKKLGFKNTPSLGTDGPQISRDLEATKSNIANAIKECRPTNTRNINTKHHVDATELDKGGYCNSEQAENLQKAFTVPHNGRQVDIYFGKHHTEKPNAIANQLAAFLPLIFGLTKIFGVDPAAVNIFLDDKSNTVAFNMGGALFFNLAWFNGLHWPSWLTKEGRLRAHDAWFFTYCHELAHNLVKDHNARHNWYQSQIAIEYSQPYRAALEGLTQGV